MDHRRLSLFRDKRITLVLDVGANTGQYARRIRNAGYMEKIVSFEPLPEAFEELSRRAAKDDNWECKRLALGATVGENSIHVAGNSQSSSLLPMLERHAAAEPNSAYIGSHTISVETLESLRQDLLEERDSVCLKLDVQGTEMSVLHGASNMLGSIEVIESEMSVVPLYEGQPLCHEMIDYLYSLGFELAWLEQGFTDPKTGQLLQFDGLFVRKP